MKDGNIKKILAAVVVAIIILAVFVGIVFNSEVIEEKNETGLFVQIGADTKSGTVPFEVTFKPLILNARGKVEYLWDFGDGTTSKEKNPKHIYQVNGSYACTLKVTEEDKHTYSDSIIIRAKANKPPVVILTVTPNSIERKFTWLNMLSFIPLHVFTYPGNQQERLDEIEKKEGANAWGEGRIVVTAQISDAEDDEIISYKWKEKTVDTLAKANGDSVQRAHNITGNNTIRIPELYTWIAIQHVVTLTVTDSAGNKANGTAYFTVSRSNKEQRLGTLKTLIFDFLILKVYDRILSEKFKHLVSDPLWKYFPIIGKLFGNIFPQPIPKAELNRSLDDSNYNFSETINQNGGVSKKTSIAHSINIRNDDKSNTAKAVYIKLKNPDENKIGLDADLENEKVIVSLQTGNTNITLYANKIFTDGFLINPDLTPGSEFSANLIVTFLEADDGTFNDGQIYNCTVFVYQSKADYWSWNIGGRPLITKPTLDEVNFYIKT